MVYVEQKGGKEIIHCWVVMFVFGFMHLYAMTHCVAFLFGGFF